MSLMKELGLMPNPETKDTDLETAYKKAKEERKLKKRRDRK